MASARAELASLGREVKTIEAESGRGRVGLCGGESGMGGSDGAGEDIFEYILWFLTYILASGRRTMR